jgi:hypothetical protein
MITEWGRRERGRARPGRRYRGRVTTSPVAWLRERAEEFDRLGAPLYAVLVRGMAGDWERGGPVREVLAGWEDAPSEAVVDLRLLGGLFRIVLERRAPALAPYYRSLGGRAPPEGAWEVAREVVAAHPHELRAALDVVPQTNEVGRAAPLVVGLMDAVSRSGLHRVRLLEIGASAGLNLRVDRFRVSGEGWAVGPADSPVRLDGAVRGPVRPVGLEVVARRGCDLYPVDPGTPGGRLRLASFVWPDHVDRHHRLAAALRVAADLPAQVDRSPALPWLEAQLEQAVAPAVLTVVWHSVVALYLPQDERETLAAMLAEAGHRGPVARVELEHRDLRAGSRPELAVTLYPGGERRVLADASHHGPPVVLRPGVSVGEVSS